MSSYVGRHAELYDLFYADKPYPTEAAFVDGCLREHSVRPPRRLLELACGTGRHAQQWAELGYNVLATDNSPDMLAVARRRSADLGSRIEFRQADMRRLNLEGQVFDAAVCLFDSIGYVQTNDAIQSVMHGVWRHLSDEALFVLEFWHAPAMWRGFEPLRVRSWDTPAGQVLRISETTLDPETQTARVRYRIWELSHDGTWHGLEETQINRFFQIQEMRSLLRSGGFEPLQWYAGFQRERTITGDTWHIVVAARRMASAYPAVAERERLQR